MPFAPHEIENKRFVTALRGYSTEEVDAFLRAVAADYQAALDAVQPVESEETLRAAEREAARIVEAARAEAEATLEEIDRRAAQLVAVEADLRLRLDELERALAEGRAAVTS